MNGPASCSIMRKMYALMACGLDYSGASHAGTLPSIVRGLSLAFWLAVMLVLQASCVHGNPLIGAWVSDHEKTLRNMQGPESGPEELLESARRARTIVETIGSKTNTHIVFTYRKNEFEQLIYTTDGTVVSRAVVPIAYLNVRSDFVAISRQDGGGIEEFFFDKSGSMYVDLRIGDFKYKEYFRRSN